MKSHRLVFILLIMVGIVVHGCDPAFDPIKKNDRHYSIFGFLNASADTQFVRIEKLRDGMATDVTNELDAEVTLTNMSNGRSQTLRDSVFNYYLEGRAHNFYTTMDVNASQEYRLEIAGREGSSSAEVQVPESFPEPEVLLDDDFKTVLKIRDVNRLIGLKTIFKTCSESCYCEERRRFTYSHREDTTHSDDGSIRGEIVINEDKKRMGVNFPSNDRFYIMRYDIVVAAGMSDWPKFAKLDDEAIALPSVATNVRGGTGFLGGIVSDTLNISDTCTPVTTRDF